MVEPNCKECPFQGSEKVYGDGPDSPEVVQVGMAPAEEELKQKKVFVGISGKILKAINQKLGYGSVYLCNSLLCKIPDEATDADKALAIQCCKERLVEDITKRHPELIVALGAMPFEELVGAFSIIKVAGRVFPRSVTKFGIAPILPVVHPAWVWRNPEFFYDFVEQMDAGIRWLNGTYQSAVEPTTVLVTRQNIDGVLDILEQAPIISLDLETTDNGLFPYGYAPDSIRCMALAADNRTAYIVPGHKCESENLLDYPRLKIVLEKAKIRFHNGQFDCGFLLQIGIRLKIYFDSMLAHYTLDERQYVHSLKRLAHKFLGAADWEEDIKEFLPKKNSSYDLIPDTRLFSYASHDVVFTNQISERLEVDVKDFPFYHRILLPSANMFNVLRHRGIRVDPRELMSLDEKLEVEVSKSEDELAELCGEPVNPNSYQEVREVLYDKLKFPVHPRYGRSSGKAVLKLFLPHPVPEKILECRHLSKLKSTYVESLARFIDPDRKIHPFTKLFASVTGRLSTEDPSVMNIAKRGGIMKIYIPEPGHKFAAFDFKGMELRCIAIESKDEHLKEILLDPDRDVHFEVAVEAFGEAGIIDKVNSHGKVVGKTHKKRNPAKTIVFGRPYGRGEESIMYAHKLSREDTSHLVEVVDGFFPNLHGYKKNIRTLIHTKGFLISYFGRYRRFGLITREYAREYERQGYNFPIQSMASDINLLCMLHLFEIREKFKAVPLWPIHDSIMFDIESEEVIPSLKKEMEDYAEELVRGEMKFPVEVKVGDNWGDAAPWVDVEYGQEG